MNRPLLAVARNGKNSAHKGTSIVDPGPGLEEGAAFEKARRAIFTPGTAAGGPRRNLQKSGLSAVGTAASFSVPYLFGFSAQMLSAHSVTWGRYVMVAAHGVVKTFESSTVN